MSRQLKYKTLLKIIYKKLYGNLCKKLSYLPITRKKLVFYNLSTNQTVQAYMVKYKSIIMCNHYYEFENKMYPCMYVFKIQIIFYKIIVLFWTINKKFKIKKGK